jgi:hypothetical protein
MHLRRIYFKPLLDSLPWWDSGFKWETESADTLPGPTCSHVWNNIVDQEVVEDTLGARLRPYAAALRERGILLLDSHDRTMEGEQIHSCLWSQ